MEYSIHACCSTRHLSSVSIDYSVSGDDSVFFYDELDLQCLSNRVNYYFGMTLNFPTKFVFGTNVMKAHFLGSVFGLSGPIRDIDKMILGCIMTTHKWPRFESTEELVKSRLFTVFGNDCRLNRFWKEWGFGELKGQRIYSFDTPQT